MAIFIHIYQLQVSLYAVKKVILSNRQQNYLDNLKGILVENALNM